MDEGDILRLYRLLYIYSVGFCTAVVEPTQRAKYKDQLLELVFQTYAKLWDEALGVRIVFLLAQYRKPRWYSLGWWAGIC